MIQPQEWIVFLSEVVLRDTRTNKQTQISNIISSIWQQASSLISLAVSLTLWYSVAIHPQLSPDRYTDAGRRVDSPAGVLLCAVAAWSIHTELQAMYYMRPASQIQCGQHTSASNSIQNHGSKVTSPLLATICQLTYTHIAFRTHSLFHSWLSLKIYSVKYILQSRMLSAILLYKVLHTAVSLALSLSWPPNSF